VIDERKQPIPSVTNPVDYSTIRDTYRVVPEEEPDAEDYSCSFALDRIFETGPDNYRKIVGSGEDYTDASFP